MHLPRLWTDAPVAKKTQVNSTTNKKLQIKKGQAGRKEPLIGPDGAKRANRADKGNQNRETRRLKGNEVNRRVRPRKVEAKEGYV